MKKVILFVMMMPYLASAQVFDNFESGKVEGWIQVPSDRWTADSAQALSGKFSLHHSYDNPMNGNDMVSMKLKGLHPSEDTTTWTFILKHGYEPSSSNNWMVLLMADNLPSVTGTLTGINGYIVGVNVTGSDDSLRLLKIKNGNISTVCKTGINWQSTIGIKSTRFIISRTPAGLWSISVSDNSGIISNSKDRNEPELFDPSFFGIVYRYTSTKDRLLWIDDISINGTFYEDLACPAVSSCKEAGKNKIKITFNEPVNERSLIKENFTLNENYMPSGISISDPMSCLLEFNNDLKNKTDNNLVIRNICDIRGNCFESVVLTFTPVWAETGDIVITEIMADPEPVVFLPDAEYIEIMNRSPFKIDLTGWKLRTGDKECVFPGKSIDKGEIVILCDEEDVKYFEKYGSVIAFPVFNSLDNSGTLVCIRDSTGNVIHGVEYAESWYNNSLKRGGGWSLEMRTVDHPFSYEGNWASSSSDYGGTPGRPNSVSQVFSDLSFYGLVNVYPQDSHSVFIRFSEPVPGLKEYSGGISIDGEKIARISPSDLLYRSFIVYPSNPLDNNKEYKLEVSGSLTDFSGNAIQHGNYIFGMTREASNGDILFNELLFNPYPGDADFIEFFNASDKIINASGLQVVSVDESSDTSNLYLLSEEKRCIMPHSYFVITTDVGRTLERYPSSCPQYLFERSMPSMPDGKGHLILLNRSLEKIDEVFYDDDMYFSQLSGMEGISLEKANPGYASDVRSNWHSATESSGWGTPGAPNSIFSETLSSDQKIELSSTRITPDNDGFEDLLVIQLKLPGFENVLTVNVFDESGNMVRRIASNFLSGPESGLFWDGTSDDGTIVRTGIYIILVEFFDETGKKVKWKKVCSVIR